MSTKEGWRARGQRFGYVQYEPFGKVKWCFMTEPNAIWSGLLSHWYGKIDNLSNQYAAVQNSQSIWWRDIQDWDGAYPSLTGWFSNAVRRKLQNGTSTLFWQDTWLSNATLKEMFPRLFLITREQNCTVADMRQWHGNVWCWNWAWRRNLYAWEEEM